MTKPNKIFEITKGDVISFVGAGGKTSLITALALSLRKSFSVAITTTTHMYPINDNRFANYLLPITNHQSPHLCGKSQIPVFFSSHDSEGKGLPPTINDIQSIASLFDVVLIEADGAHGKSLKIPRAHEPVVPDFSKKVLLVAGLDALGKKISDGLVFHPEIFKENGWGAGTIINWQILRNVLCLHNGYLDKLKGKEIFLCLHKSDRLKEDTGQAARMLFHDNIKSIIMSNTKNGKLKLELVNNSKVKVFGIMLAAGRSLRYGSSKLSDKFKNQPLFLHSFKAANRSKLDGLIMVTGETTNELIKLAHNVPHSRAEFIRNPRPAEGISSSIKIGLRKVMKNNPGSAAMIMLADMPNVTSDLINNVLEGFHNSAALISAPFICGRNAHPVVFHPSLFPELLKLEGDRGGKEIIMKHLDLTRKIPLASASSQFDIDTTNDAHSAISQ